MRGTPRRTATVDSEDDRPAFEREQVFRDGEGGEFLPPTPQEHSQYLEAEVKRLQAMHAATLRGAEQEIMVREEEIADLGALVDTGNEEVRRLRGAVAKLTETRDSLASLLETVLRSCRAEDRGRMAPSHGLLDAIEAALARAGRTDG